MNAWRRFRRQSIRSRCLASFPSWCWSLILVVSVKYTLFVLRADNRGEGGIFALLALGQLDRGVRQGLNAGTIIVLIGAAMLCGEAVITPAITVMSAVEGIKLVLPGVEYLVVPLSCLILAGLFAFQYHGTKFIGRIFGPVMLVWFIVLGAFGLGVSSKHRSCCGRSIQCSG